MKHYPSIPKYNHSDSLIYAFDKYDGSNIRAEWSPKQGFYKFGTKNQLIDKSSPYGISIELIRNKYESLNKTFKDLKYESAVCFFELFGPSSFAGSHDFKEQLDVILFDINPFKKGILFPEDFIKVNKDVETAKVLYHGKVTTELFDQVKQSTLPGMGLEGVVCKGVYNDKLIMFKIKSKAWLDKLKIHCGDNESLFNTLE